MDKAKKKTQSSNAGSGGAQVQAAVSALKPGAGAAKPKVTPPSSQIAKSDVARSGNGQ